MRYLYCSNQLCPGGELDRDAEVTLTAAQVRILAAGLDANASPGSDAFRDAWAVLERATTEQPIVVTPNTWNGDYDPGSYVDPPSYGSPECPVCDQGGEGL